MKSLSEIAEDILRTRGIDPAALDDVPPVPPFDPVEWRLEQVGAALDVVVPTEFAEAVPDHPVVVDWVGRFNAGERLSLLLAGPTGSGKSHQAFGALRQVVVAAARANESLDFRATTHPKLNDLMRPRKDDSHQGALEPYERCDLLLLDDVGAARQTDWNTDGLVRLVNHRWSNQLPTIYTTNLSAKDLETAVSDRVASRMFAAVRAAVRGSDRRHGGVR